MTPQQFQQCMGAIGNGDRLAPWIGEMTIAMARASVNTPLREAHFLAQIGHESNGLRHTIENLNYSAEKLLKMWPARFTPITAAAYARQPERIANRVYASRMGNGAEPSGDGWRYRGRGPLQCTGKSNYLAFGKWQAPADPERFVREPELLEQPLYGSLFCAWYWIDRKINPLADADNLEAVTRKINGGLNGIEDRRARLALCKRVLGI